MAINDQLGERLDIRNAPLSAIEDLVVQLKAPKFHAKQIFRWLHQRGVRQFEEMTDLPKKLRESLGQYAVLHSMTMQQVECSVDGTRKYAFKTAAGQVVESVFIPEASSASRNTLCISSQVGCAVDCQFCLTASLGFVRNLGFGEIVEQITRVREDLQSTDTYKEVIHPINNIVMMGMGEPLHNYRALIPALQTMNSDMGHGISTRRITVSTSGMVPKIEQLGHDIPVNLAVSLNATTNEIRDEIMPINKKWNIEELLEACRRFPLPERRRITFEYVLLEGINDSLDDARRLIKLLRGIRNKVNLIPFNEHPFSPYRRPSKQKVSEFQDVLGKAGYTVLVRTPRGDDISAACGQLGVEVSLPKRTATERNPRLRVL